MNLEVGFKKKDNSVNRIYYINANNGFFLYLHVSESTLTINYKKRKAASMKRADTLKPRRVLAG